MAISSSKSIRLLVADENQVARIGLRDLIGRDSQLKIVAEAGSSTDAVSQAVQTATDVVLLHLELPGGGGVKACREILARAPRTRVVLLASQTDSEAVLAGMKAGAHGYLLKQMEPEALIRSIKLVAAGHSVFDFSAIKHIRSKLQEPEGTTRQTNLRTLSSQEQRVMVLVVEGKTNKEIGTALNLSDKTIRNYLYHIYKKLHIQRRTQAAVFFLKQKANY